VIGSPPEVTLNDLQLVRAAASAGQAAVVAAGNRAQLTNPGNLAGTPSVSLAVTVAQKASGVFRVSVGGRWATANPTDLVNLQVFLDGAAITGAPIVQVTSVAGVANGSLTWLVTLPAGGANHQLSLHLQDTIGGQITAQPYGLFIVAEELA
jgi:hypothetical protein